MSVVKSANVNKFTNSVFSRFPQKFVTLEVQSETASLNVFKTETETAASETFEITRDACVILATEFKGKQNVVAVVASNETLNAGVVNTVETDVFATLAVAKTSFVIALETAEAANEWANDILSAIKVVRAAPVAAPAAPVAAVEETTVEEVAAVEALPTAAEALASDEVTSFFIGTLRKQGNAGFKSWTNRAVAVLKNEEGNVAIAYWPSLKIKGEQTDAVLSETALRSVAAAGGVAGARGQLELAQNTAVWVGFPFGENNTEVAESDNQLVALIFDCPEIETAQNVHQWSYSVAKDLFDAAPVRRRFIFKGVMQTYAFAKAIQAAVAPAAAPAAPADAAASAPVAVSEKAASVAPAHTVFVQGQEIIEQIINASKAGSKGSRIAKSLITEENIQQEEQIEQKLVTPKNCCC